MVTRIIFVDALEFKDMMTYNDLSSNDDKQSCELYLIKNNLQPFIMSFILKKQMSKIKICAFSLRLQKIRFIIATKIFDKYF